MKMTLLYILVFTLLGCHATKETQVQSDTQKDNDMKELVREGAGVGVFNNEDQLLTDALVYVNDELIPFDSTLLAYRFPSGLQMPYHLKVEHSDYETFEDETMYYDNTKLYLLEKGDTYYWENGIKVPVQANENEFYLMLFNEHTFSDEQRAEMDEEIEDLLKDFKFDIVAVHFDNKFNDIFFRKLVFTESLNQKKLEDVYQRFSTYERTQFFGPFLKRNQSQPYEGLGLSQKLEIRFTRPFSETERNDFFDEYNLELENTSSEATYLYTLVSFKQDLSLEQIIKQADALNTLPLIRYANNQLFVLDTH